MKFVEISNGFFFNNLVKHLMKKKLKCYKISNKLLSNWKSIKRYIPIIQTGIDYLDS